MKSTTRPPITSRGFYWALGGLVAVFGAVRFAGLFNDLWLDEIWSVRLVQEIHSPVEILTKLWHDNNHPLSSLWLYLLGPGHAAWAYRLLSAITGTAAVGLAGLIARQQYQRLHPEEPPTRAAAAGLIGAVLIGGCYFLIHYSSEARGYAPAIFFVFLALFALGHADTRPASGWAAVFGFACMFGLLAHLVAFQVMLAGLVWSEMLLFKNWSRWRDRMIHLACWHLGPWLFLGFYYLIFISKMQIGGGPTLVLVDVLGTTSAFTLGFPHGMGTGWALPILLGIALGGMVPLWRRDRSIAGFYAVGIIPAPIIGLVTTKFVYLNPRYFIVSAAFALLVAAYVIGRMWNSGRWVRWGAVVLLGVFLLGNGIHTGRLLRDGRGQYQAALRYIAERTPAGPITVSSDSDFRNFSVMDYYKSAVGPQHQLQYYSTSQPPPVPLQWIFFHRLDESTPVPPDALHDVEGHTYQLVRVFPHAAFSGWEWYVYRNLDPSVLPPSP